MTPNESEIDGNKCPKCGGKMIPSPTHEFQLDCTQCDWSVAFMINPEWLKAQGKFTMAIDPFAFEEINMQPPPDSADEWKNWRMKLSDQIPAIVEQIEKEAIRSSNDDATIKRLDRIIELLEEQNKLLVMIHCAVYWMMKPSTIAILKSWLVGRKALRQMGYTFWSYLNATNKTWLVIFIKDSKPKKYFIVPAKDTRTS